MLGLALADAQHAHGPWRPTSAATTFAVLVAGGVAVGAVIGAVWVLLLRRLEDESSMICASILICWVAYMSGELIHVSGAIAAKNG